MADYRVLYYPYFEPKPTWLLSTLLFVDGVNRIIPAQAQHKDSKRIVELRNALTPDPALPIEPIGSDLWIEQSDRQRMKRAFELIIKDYQTNRAHRQNIQLGYNLIHRAKIPHPIMALLKRNKLVGETKSSNQAEKGMRNGFLPVEKRAAGLILSYVADRIAKREGIDAITDYKLGFVVNALENQNVPFNQPAGFASGALIASIASCEVPGEIRYLSIEAYKELRNSYADIRGAFKQLSAELAYTNRLDRIDDFGVFQSRLESTIEDFVTECDRYRNSRYAKKVKKWGPWGVGSLLNIAASIVSPRLANAGKFAQAAFQVVDRKVNKQTTNPVREHAYQILCDLREDVIKTSQVKTLLHL